MVAKKKSNNSNDEGNNPNKRSRVDSEPTSSDMALVTLPGSLELTVSGNVRDKLQSSSLLSSSTAVLTGHTEAVYSIAFDTTGEYLASASLDRQIMLWDIKGECKNYNVMLGHKNAILEIKWLPQSSKLVSCSADKTVAVWDANKGQRIRKYTDHSGIVNCCSVGKNNQNLFCSGSDDCTG